MRKVRSCPQLSLLASSATTCQISRTSTDNTERHSPMLIRQCGVHGPHLPPRRLRTTPRSSGVAWSLSAGFVPGLVGEMGTVAQNVESEVVIESETNSVAMVANSCFAQYGKSPLEAPDLFFGSKENLTETEKSLAVCLATPFEGDPEMLPYRLQPRLLVAFARDQEKLVLSEIERRHLRHKFTRQQFRKEFMKNHSISTSNQFTLDHFIIALLYVKSLLDFYKKNLNSLFHCE